MKLSHKARLALLDILELVLGFTAIITVVIVLGLMVRGLLCL